MNVLASRSRNGLNPAKTVCVEEEGAAQFVDRLLASNFLLTEDWDALALDIQERVLWCVTQKEITQLLVEHNLLTQYQASRILAGTDFGLVLGNYRILDRIGAGGMAIVFKAEHMDLRNLVAIKVLPMAPGADSRLESRFFSEMRMVARLRHPNIVAAVDAGRAINPDQAGPWLRYLVMEYVPGTDLEEYVRESGPLPVDRACNLAYQVAAALGETNKYNLVHRDIKPSNIMVTPEERAKLLDFGLSRNFETRLTTPGTILGTIDYMAPEQARDASSVDVRADLFSLGGVLFWSLTGHLPFATSGSAVENLARRMNQAPPSLKQFLSDVPPALDEILKKMMATDANARYQTPQAVMQALLPFLKGDCQESSSPSGATPSGRHDIQRCAAAAEPPRVLIVDDEQEIRMLCRHVLSAQQIQCDEANSAEAAIKAVAAERYDLVLMDVTMPGMAGSDAIKLVRDKAGAEFLKIIMFSGQATPDEMSQMLLHGADDYLSKPFSVMQFLGRVRAALRLKGAQDHLVELNQRLLNANEQLELSLQTNSCESEHARNALALGVALLVAQRDGRSRNHTRRAQLYCRLLAESAAKSPKFAIQIDRAFIELLEAAAPLRDVGMILLPDHILLKGGTLSAEERMLMQTHTSAASDVIKEAASLAATVDSMRVIVEVVRHHHERYDGSGYPDGLASADIPLSARLVAIADVYDALRSRRAWKPALSHFNAVHIIMQGSPGQFDPQLLQIFQEVHPGFEIIYREHGD
jgi:response regulator RpfG family c-di-GMP phosphodiesterase/tRNA A-37 threonylcarbamoyl transferase component Bud32